MWHDAKNVHAYVQGQIRSRHTFWPSRLAELEREKNDTATLKEQL